MEAALLPDERTDYDGTIGILCLFYQISEKVKEYLEFINDI